MIKKGLLALCFLSLTAQAFELKKFTVMQQKPIAINIVVIGGDDYSTKWLDQNVSALIKYHIPIFTVDMSLKKQQSIFEKYDKKIIIGQIDETQKKIFEQMGINYYPALYAKDGTVFQSKK